MKNSIRSEGVAIIGAGTSGVVCTKVFRQQGIAVDCFEKGSGLGGLWRFENDNEVGGCYRSLHINTSKRVMELSDYPMPEHMAEFPSHSEIVRYFDDYADHFDVRPHIRFNTEVLQVERCADGSWDIHLRGPAGEEKRNYRWLVVANGHHWDVRMAKFPGQFDGAQLHAHHYVDSTSPYDFRGKRVVVVGSGNSAMDIACELGQAARASSGPVKVFLSQRSGVWITPKVLGNMPQDKFIRHPMKRPGGWERFRRRWIPRAWRLSLSNVLSEYIVRSVAGDPRRVGLKPPKDRFVARHGTVSQDIHARLIHGDITPKGNIVEMMGDRVRFEDGSIEAVDAIVHCSGYRISFPFLDTKLISAPGNNIALWRRIFDPRYRNLMFLALVQPKCSMMPIAELQSHYLAQYITGRYQLPSVARMEAELKADQETLKAQFIASESHTIQIDCDEYSYHLYEELDRGMVRAKAAA
ncbi:Predicted flavoprotein CzcO associated with the cation diffusion facilitator CzcD [Collimonas sp. OK607]|uniref:flavin-containing monooxygenase n=1 Tax=Collimonas sp. OK607 TaxID=1798194 RepID=UPI0008EA3251|nr:NAD(P)-binding domain-containing protein [Collimonas sp. OK607]SFA82836.1 Predicted flavoprotein CzcO associated with the cation diffusion facilitator CzcD [Collimonas sp. OK607]